MSKVKRSRKTILKRSMVIFGIVLLGLVLFLAGRLLVLRHNVGQYKRYWQQQAETPAPQNALTYVALGDSAAQGIGASKPMNGYVGLIANALSKKNDRPVHIINLSATGAKVGDVIDDQLPRLQKYNIPADAVVTIDVGANNMRHFEPVSFKEQYEKLLMMLPRQTVVADIPYFGPDYHGHGGKEATMANMIIVPLLEKHGFRHAQLYKETKENESLRNYGADFFHPSNRGYQYWFQAYWQQLQ